MRIQEPIAFICRLLQQPEYIGYRPKDKSLYRFRFGSSPCLVAQNWFWVTLVVSYTVSEYLSGKVTHAEREKIRFAFVREKMQEKWFNPHVGVEFELTGNKDGHRFRRGAPYHLVDVNLYAPFDVPSPTAAKKSAPQKKRK